MKGYELPSGQYVLIDDAELSGLDPEASRTIDIEEFVDLDEIDPIFYDTAYYVAPDKATTKPYALLARAMEETGKVGIARFVMRSKQYLCAVRPKDGKLLLSTMVYADEVNDPPRSPSSTPSRRPSSPTRSSRWPSSSSSRWRRTSSPSSSRTPTATRCSTSSSARRPARPASSRCPRSSPATRSSTSWPPSRRRWRRPRKPASATRPVTRRRRRPRRSRQEAQVRVRLPA